MLTFIIHLSIASTFDLLCRIYKVKVTHVPIDVSLNDITKKLDTIDQLTILYQFLIIMGGTNVYGLLCFQILHELIKSNLHSLGIFKLDTRKSIEKIILVNFISASLGLYVLNTLPSSLAKGVEYVTFWLLSLVIRSRIKARDHKFNFYVSTLIGIYSLTNDFIFMLMGLATIFPHVHLYESEVKTVVAYTDGFDISKILKESYFVVHAKRLADKYFKKDKPLKIRTINLNDILKGGKVE